MFEKNTIDPAFLDRGIIAHTRVRFYRINELDGSRPGGEYDGFSSTVVGLGGVYGCCHVRFLPSVSRRSVIIGVSRDVAACRMQLIVAAAENRCC